MLSYSIWFSAPSFWMGGGRESRCLGRVYGTDGAVRRMLSFLLFLVFPRWPIPTYYLNKFLRYFLIFSCSMYVSIPPQASILIYLYTRRRRVCLAHFLVMSHP